MNKSCRRAMHKERGLARAVAYYTRVYRAFGCPRKMASAAGRADSSTQRCASLLRDAERHEHKRLQLLDRIHGKLGCL